MEDLRTGRRDYEEDWSDRYSGPYSYYDSSVTEPTNKEDESLEEKFALYKIQNMIAVVAVLLLIIMDIFDINVGNISAQAVFQEIANSFTVQEFFQQLF